MEILVHQPSEVEIGNENYEVLNPIKFHNMYLSLYDKYNSGTLEINDDSYLKGYVRVKNAYEYAINFLETIYADYGLHIDMTDPEPYYEFEDFNTQMGCSILWGGGNPGMTMTQIKNTTLWPKEDYCKSANYWKDVVKFNEFALFIRLTTPTTRRIFRQMPLLEEIDCTNVTQMPEAFLESCPNLWKVGADANNELPNLRYLDNYVFNGTAIERISIPTLTNNTKIQSDFNGCSKLTTVHIDGANLTKIDSDCFKNCTKLETVTGLTHLTEVGYSAFYNCTSLSQVDNINNVTSFGSYSFRGCVNMDFDLSKAKTIGDSAFWGSGITVANLESMTSIEPSVFGECPNLTTVIFPDTYDDYVLPTSMFYRSNNLVSVNLDNCKEIGNQAFKNCSSLSDIGDTVKLTKISGESNFEETLSLRTINLSNIKNVPRSCFYHSGVRNIGDTSKIEKIDSSAFFRSSISGNLSFPALVTLNSYAFRECPNIESLTLGENCTYINTTNQSESFRNCTSMRTFTAYIDKIGGNDFYECKSLETVNMPNALSIGGNAFASCTALTTLNIPLATSAGSNAFRRSGIVNLSLPALESIGSEACVECKNLESINLPAMKTISNSVFNNCANLTTVADMPQIESIGESAFNRCVSITGTIDISNATNIGGWTFYGCTSLQGLVLNSENITVGDGAFSGCEALTTINTEGIEVLGRRTFEGCSSITSLDLTNLKRLEANNNYNEGSHFRGMSRLTTVTSLENLEFVDGNDSFYNCQSLVTAPLSNKLTRIPPYFFQNCYKLENCGDLTGLEWIGRQAFDQCKKLNYNGDLSNVINLGSFAFRGSNIGPNLNLPKWDTMCDEENSPEYRFFQGCENLVNVNIPSITNIPVSTFENCIKLESVTLSSELTELGNWAFQRCRKLNSIDLPETLTRIGNGAFNECSTLKTVTCRAFTPPTLGANNIFQSCNIQTIYVPESSVDTYKAATYWKNYNIQPISE